ncbi:hypothetical protein KP509_03G013600 [Ceratopteris richardii]|uniref:Uncharacterized protein n=1 Tax=Ceratopteris richardii TaxID=49495 RepID=A0A8T2UX97_CERRI|nr:hypothetical protein KP509_03G013600 [Ceratopteris richardii]
MLSSDSLVSASHVTNGTKMMLRGSSARYQRLLASPPNNVIMLEQRYSLMSCRDSNIARAMVTTTIWPRFYARRMKGALRFSP